MKPISQRQAMRLVKRVRELEEEIRDRQSLIDSVVESHSIGLWAVSFDKLHQTIKTANDLGFRVEVKTDGVNLSTYAYRRK